MRTKWMLCFLAVAVFAFVTDVTAHPVDPVLLGIDTFCAGYWIGCLIERLPG